MKLQMIKCDVKKCGRLVNLDEGHSLVFAGKLYDFCDECFQEINKWIETTLIEGKVEKENKPDTASTPELTMEWLEEYYKKSQPKYYPVYHWWDAPKFKSSDITWVTTNDSSSIEYVANPSSSTELDYFDKWIGRNQG